MLNMQVFYCDETINKEWDVALECKVFNFNSYYVLRFQTSALNI